MKEHPTRGTIQALLDGELDASAREAASSHVSACARCRAIRASLERDSALFSSAVAGVDARPSDSEADLPRTRPGTPSTPARPGRMGKARPRPATRWSRAAIMRAAALIIVFAGAAAAVVPGSPVGDWVREVKRQLAGEPAAPAPEPNVEIEGGDAAAISLLPDDGRLRVVVTGFSAESTVRVRIVEGIQGYVTVRRAAENPRFVTAPGRIEVNGQGDGEIWIDLPKSAVEASVEVNGRSVIRKEGEQLRMVRPATDSLFGDILFKVGP